MKTLKMWTIYIVLNGLMLGGLIYGALAGVQTTANVGLFLSWMSIVGSVMAFATILYPPTGAEMMNPENPRIPRWIDRFTDTAALVLLVYLGFIATAVFYFLHWIVAEVVEYIRSNPELQELAVGIRAENAARKAAKVT